MFYPPPETYPDIPRRPGRDAQPAGQLLRVRVGVPDGMLDTNIRAGDQHLPRAAASRRDHPGEPAPYVNDTGKARWGRVRNRTSFDGSGDHRIRYHGLWPPTTGRHYTWCTIYITWCTAFVVVVVVHFVAAVVKLCRCCVCTTCVVVC